MFDETSYRLIFIGHLHQPMVFGKRCLRSAEATRHRFEYNKPFAFSADDSYIVCVGSVGYGRDRMGRLRYGIYDAEEQALELRAIEGPLLAMDGSAPP